MAGTWGNVSDLNAAKADDWFETAKNETQKWLADMGYTPQKQQPALSISLPTAEDYHASAPWRDLDTPKATTAAAPVSTAPTMPSARPAPGTPAPMPQITATASTLGQPDNLEGWARSEARRLGIDPETAVRVANTEGGFADPVRQNMEGAPAYGPYQMYVGGPENPGLGDEMLARGIDPRRPENARAAITYALEHAAKSGWGAFQGAAANGIGQWDGIGQAPQAQVENAQTTAGIAPMQPVDRGGEADWQRLGNLTPNQISAATSEGLDYETALAVCGPAAAIAFARKTGRNPTMQEALALAREVGWTVEQGMAGPGSQQRLLERMGVASRMVEGAPDWGTVAADVARGNPVILSTPGHYFVAERYDPESGMFDFGESAAVLKASKGRRWFRPEEIASLGMGDPRAALFMDSPQSPSPSVVAGRTDLNAGAPTPAASPPSAPAGPPPAGPPPAGPPPAGAPSALDEARASTNSQQPMMMRGPLSQQSELPADEPYDPRMYDEAPGAREAIPYGPGLEGGVPEQPSVQIVQGGPPPDDGSGQTVEFPPTTRTTITQGGPPPDDGSGQVIETQMRPRQQPEPATAQQDEPLILDQSVPAPPGWVALVNAAGNVVQWVQDRAQEAGQAVRSGVQAVNDAGTAVAETAKEWGIEPGGGGARQLERMEAIIDQAARDQGVDPSNPSTYLTARRRAVQDPGWRARNPELASEYDSLEEQFGLNVMGQAGDAARFGRVQRPTKAIEQALTSDYGPRIQETPDAVRGPESIERVQAARGETPYDNSPVPPNFDQQPLVRDDAPRGGDINLNATPGISPSSGPDILGNISRDVGSSIGSSMFGGAVGAGLPADSEEERLQNIRTGAGIGLIGGPLARRLARGSGAMATPGISPGGGKKPIPGQPIKMTGAEEVKRLRLDKFPEEVRADIEAAAKGLNFAHEQRRGVLPDAVVQQMAADDLKSVDQMIRGGKAGKAYNPEETYALRNAVASQAQIVRELSEEIGQARSAGHSPELLVARRAAEATKLDGLVQIAEGARAEAGRTLRAYRQQARLIELNPTEAVERIYRKLGGRDNATEAVDEYTKMVQDGANPIQLAKFWAKIEAGKITGSDLFSLYRRFNMLSGPRTFEVNALSGAVNLGYEVVSSALGTAARGRGGEAVAEIAAPFKASGRAFKNLAETMYHGVSMEQAARGDIPRTLSSRTDNPAAKKALTILETPDRFNAGVDQFFRTMTEDWAATRLAHKQAREAKLSPRSPEWAETVAKNLEAIRDDPSKFPEIKAMADRVTFSEEPGAVGKGLEAFRQRAPLVANLLFPFIRTPYNIASRAIDISPLGIVRTGAEVATGLGRGRTNLAPRLRDNVLGTAAAVWAYDQARQGNITGAGPDDPEKTAQLRATGWQPFSVKIGDQYWSYANFAPFNLALSSAAAAHEAQKYAKDGKTDALSMLSDGAARTAKVVTDMTVLAGLGAVVKSIQDPDRYGTQWLSQFLQTLIPAGSFVNTVGQATDPLIRRSERTDVGTQVSQNLQARIPGLRENVPAAQDPLGRPIKNEQTGLGALNPFRPTTERANPTLQPFIDAGVDIGAPKQTLTIRAGSPPIALTAAEQRRWNELRGEQLQKTAPKLQESPGFQRADKVGREAVMKRILNAASESADRLLIGEIGGPEVSRRLREVVQQKRAS